MVQTLVAENHRNDLDTYDTLAIIEEVVPALS